MSALHRLNRWMQHHTVVRFVLLTWIVSLLPFAAIVCLEVNPFTDARWLPLLLPMVWGPTLAACASWWMDGTLKVNLKAFFRLGRWPAWLFALSPVAVLVGALLLWPPKTSVPSSLWLLMLTMNLILGPLGEEAGWRGYLLPRLVPLFGSMRASLVTGVVWAVWHLPLWTIDSPQASIPFALFFATTLCFSVVLTAIWQASPESLWPCVVFHLGVNVVANALEVLEVLPAAAAFEKLLPAYLVLAAVASLVLLRRRC